MDKAKVCTETAPTVRDDIAFWLYTSGSTGRPKGAVHCHADLKLTDDLYGGPFLDITENDVCYSVAKLFFAYGLGNALTFPMSVGACTVLLPDRPTPEGVAALLRRHPVTVFYAVPTFYAAFLASASAPQRADVKFRCCVSAGEALPPDVGKRWVENYGVDILDGIGSTEMLHIFLSNRAGEVKYGTTGKPVPGYDVQARWRRRPAGEEGRDGRTADQGAHQRRSCTGTTASSRCSTFLGHWTRSGDKYIEDEQGYFVYCGRHDDMLKVSGLYVSPFEVEGALPTHPDVLEAAVVAWPDADALIKPKAFVVLKDQTKVADAPLVTRCRGRCRSTSKRSLRPTNIRAGSSFGSDLPKTATGKIQRFKLRSEAAPR